MAEHLVGMDLYATCALLNSTSKAVREETSPVLWRRVVYRWNNSQNGRKKSAVKWKITFSCPAAKYIQYVPRHQGKHASLIFRGGTGTFLLSLLALQTLPKNYLLGNRLFYSFCDLERTT
jgi:hypothetical protein